MLTQTRLDISNDSLAVVRDLINSITPDLYSVDRFIDWGELERELSILAAAINQVQSTVESTGDLTSGLAAALHREPLVYRVLTTLMSVPHGAGFVDGREMPSPVSPEDIDAAAVSDLFFELGGGRMLHAGCDVENLVRCALVARDSVRRRYRIGSSFDDRVQHIVATVMATVANGSISLLPRSQWPAPAREERISHVFASGNQPVLAIAPVFQTATGGRQTRDLQIGLPVIRESLAEFGLRLVVIADGRGIRAAASRVLEALVDRVDFCMTLRQAESGRLMNALLDAVERPLVPRHEAAVDIIIDRAIRDRPDVSTGDLPLAVGMAQQAIATYKSKHPELDLDLSADLHSIVWRRPSAVAAAQALQRYYQAESAITSLGTVLGLSVSMLPNQDNYLVAIMSASLSDPVIPDSMIVVALEGAPSSQDILAVATIALQKTPWSRLALLLCPALPNEPELDMFRASQSLLTANVVVLDPSFIFEVSTATAPPLEALARRVLEQSDLVKASPFVLNSSTPARMFYGRVEEEAFLAATLSSNSVALLGGRRIGKTSLMNHVQRRLESAGYSTFSGDCQTVQDWEGFARLAQRTWGVAVSSPFVPENLYQLVEALRDNTPGPHVILLDEIDQLVSWDKNNSGRDVPEAFFRACRAISQEGKVQFVFSGERTITTRLWDASSPHWNFCQPLILRQLRRIEATELLLAPLASIGVAVDERDSFAEMLWHRTSGHPQIIQYVGDRLMRLLNERPPSARSLARQEDLAQVTETYAFAEHYLETYWGQATPIERIVSLITSDSAHTFESLRSRLTDLGVRVPDELLHHSLRMLELYGFLDGTTEGYQSRLAWLESAAGYFGGVDELIAASQEELNGRV